MYEASIANAGPHHATLDELPAYCATLTTQARACLAEALRPAPTGPLDGQDPLIEETT